MRIDPKVVVPSIKATTPETDKQPQPGRAEHAASAVVSLSSAAKAVTPQSGTNPVIAARLDKIRAMLDAGQYPVDLDELASRIVDDEFVRSGKSS